MLEKLVVIDSINIIEDGQMQIRQATKIMEDGKEISKTYHRWCLAPGQDVTDQIDKVKDITNTVWTPDVVSAFKSKREAKEKEDEI